MTLSCSGKTKAGRPCKAQPAPWPKSLDGNPMLCGHHLPAPLRAIRDAHVANEERERRERFAARDPQCWSWSPTLNWDRVAEYYGEATGELERRFHAGEEQARHIAFAAWHNDRCAVCGFRDRRLVKDHDHDTGYIRGLLCRSCNGSEPYGSGPFQKYRDRSPAAILGVRLRYSDPIHGEVGPASSAGHRPDSHPAYKMGQMLTRAMKTDE